jgi:hypothetical protein
MCAAVSQPGTTAIVYPGGVPVIWTIKDGGQSFICTLHPDHRNRHSACDGGGHVLATWPRRKDEQRWQRADCKRHGHG